MSPRPPSSRHVFPWIAAACLAVFVPTAPAGPKLTIDNTPASQPAPKLGPVVKRVAPSVVNIYTAKIVRENTRVLLDDDFIRQFFGMPGRYQSIPRERREQSLGSGVIVSQDGYVLTNNHVIAGADEIKVALSDDKTIYDARLIGTDPQTDVAVLKVEARDLPAITVTDSDKVEVGDIVLAIGNPFGVGQAVTMGIVSAKGRGGMGIVDYEDFIQTDASINPGNSGGALVDVTGRLVGINSAILSRSGGNQGIGFAIPANLARSVMERLVAEGRVTRGYLGATSQSLTPELARAFGIPESSGALVGDVASRSPAAEAGLQSGDVIVEFNGKRVDDSRHLNLLSAETTPGVKVPLKILRDGKPLTLSLKLAPIAGESFARQESQPGTRRSVPNAGPLDGVTVANLDLRSRQQLNVPRSMPGGALIVEVGRETPAARAGLRSGDVILEIDRQEVNDPDDAVRIGRGLKGDRALLRIWSNNASRYVVLSGTRKS